MLKKLVERCSHGATLAAIVLSLLVVYWYLRQWRCYRTLDMVASWSLLLACFCPILVYRRTASRGLFLILSTTLLWINGYISDAITKPLSKWASFSYETYFWSNSDLDVIAAIFFPLIIAVAKLLEVETRVPRTLHGRRAVGVAIIWGAIVALVYFVSWSEVVHYCLAIVASVWLAAYMYHVARTEYLLCGHTLRSTTNGRNGLHLQSRDELALG